MSHEYQDYCNANYDPEDIPAPELYPLAPIITVEWSWRYFYFAKFRCANFRRFQIGWLTIMTRAKRLGQ